MREGFPALEGKKILGLDILPWSGTNRVSLALISLSIFSLVYTRFSNSEQSASFPSPFLLIPESTRRTVELHFTSPRPSRESAFLLVIAGLLELYYFTSPIYVDIFINEAGWSQEKYNGIVGGIALLGSVTGQIIGGILGDKFGIVELRWCHLWFLLSLMLLLHS